MERALHKTDAGNFWHVVCREFENQNALNPYRDAVKAAPTWRDRLVAIRDVLIDETHDEFTRWKIATLNAHRLANFVVSA